MQTPRDIAAAINGLEGVLAPVDSKVFLAEYWKQSLLHVAGPEGRFAHLAPWDALSHILSTQRLPSPRLQLVRGGREIPPDRYRSSKGPNERLNAGAMSSLLSQGATLVLAYVDEILPLVGALSDAIGAALKAQTNVNLYAGWRTDNGFALHWDAHDVIVLQLSGRKRWRIHRPAYPSPLKNDRFIPPPDNDEPAWEGMLEDGAFLYIPRGWAHVATPVDEPSLHLTVAIRSPNAMDFLRWFVDDVAESDVLRSDFPTMSAAKIDKFMSEIRGEVTDRIGAPTAARFLEWWGAEQTARPVFNLPGFDNQFDGPIHEVTRFRLAARRRLGSAKSAGTGQPMILADGREWPCSVAVAERLAMLSSETETRFGTLVEGLGDEDRDELGNLLRNFVRVGVLFAYR